MKAMKAMKAMPMKAMKAMKATKTMPSLRKEEKPKPWIDLPDSITWLAPRAAVQPQRLQLMDFLLPLPE